jgi:hypothetical protein
MRRGGNLRRKLAQRSYRNSLLHDKGTNALPHSAISYPKDFMMKRESVSGLAWRGISVQLKKFCEARKL